MKLNVAVFFGGASCEHEISCISASQVIKALDQEKYNIIPLYISKNMDIYYGEALEDIGTYYDLDALCNKLQRVTLVKDMNCVSIMPIQSGFFKKKSLGTIDVAFLVMHGTNGEDGTLQGYMEMLKLPYTSSDVLGSAIGQDKAIMKLVLKAENVPMTPWFYCLYTDFIEDENKYVKKAEELGYPVIIKPANLGSSIGIEIAHNSEEFADKMKKAGNYDFKLVIEKMITDLMEVNISVMGNLEKAKTSAIEEVIKNNEILTFGDKYEGGSKSSKTKMPVKGSKGMASTSRKVPADLNADDQKKIEELALKTFKVLNANGCVRIDFLIDRSNNEIYVNEINSIPGSLAFYLWQETGLDFTSECDELITNALKRHHAKEKKTYSFTTNILSNFRR